VYVNNASIPTLILGTNYLFTNRRLIVFFYIDDIAILFAKKDLLRLKEFKAKLLY